MSIYVITAKSPRNITTRLVFGCAEPAQATGQALYECGYEVIGDAVETPPERTPEEMRRAQELVALIHASQSQSGHA